MTVSRLQQCLKTNPLECRNGTAARGRFSHLHESALPCAGNSFGSLWEIRWRRRAPVSASLMFHARLLRTLMREVTSCISKTHPHISGILNTISMASCHWLPTAHSETSHMAGCHKAGWDTRLDSKSWESWNQDSVTVCEAQHSTHWAHNAPQFYTMLGQPHWVMC